MRCGPRKYSYLKRWSNNMKRLLHSLFLFFTMVGYLILYWYWTCILFQCLTHFGVIKVKFALKLCSCAFFEQKVRNVAKHHDFVLRLTWAELYFKYKSFSASEWANTMQPMNTKIGPMYWNGLLKRNKSFTL